MTKLKEQAKLKTKRPQSEILIKFLLSFIFQFPPLYLLPINNKPPLPPHKGRNDKEPLTVFSFFQQIFLTNMYLFIGSGT